MDRSQLPRHERGQSAIFPRSAWVPWTKVSFLFPWAEFRRANTTNLAFDLFSFALVEISLILAKMHWTYDLELMDKNLDWEGQSHMHVMWWKPAVNIRFSEAR